MTNHSPSTGIDTDLAFSSLWSEGSHSLCVQQVGGQFRFLGWFDSPEELLERARVMPDTNVWWGVHGVADKPSRGRGGEADVTSIVALSADYDWADPDAHSDADLPTEEAVRAAVSAIVPHPTLIIESGHGLQAYWRLTEELGPDYGKFLSDGFFRYVEAEYGLHNDRTDLASIMRVPGTRNHKSMPIKDVTIIHYDDDMGAIPQWIEDNAWLPVPVIEPPAPVSPPPVQVSTPPVVSRETQTPIEWVKEHFDAYDALLRLGWQPGARRGDEEQLTRPGKDARHGTSATFHHDTGAVNIYTSTLPAEYMQLGKAGRGVTTLTPFDMWCVENGFSDASAAARHIRTLMPKTPTSPPSLPVSVEGTQTGRITEDGDDDVSDPLPESGLNLPDEFWTARPQLEHIRQAAWCTSTSPDAVLAGVLARYSANLHPKIQLPQWGTFDLFVIIEGHSGAGKSKASKTASKLYPGINKAVMMDHNVGSGEGLAEAFYDFLDEDGNVCGANKKGAVKTRTRWGMHFATDEGVALTASAARQGSIIIPTLCSAWMGESIGQGLADPTKSRIIGPHTIRVSAEVKIQTAHGHRLFAEEYASTGLAQRMLCFHATDPTIYERYEAGMVPPTWPGPLDLPSPAIIGDATIVGVCDEIAALLAQRAAEVHNPAWVGNPLDTHASLAQLKISGLLALWDDRQTILSSDWALAGMILITSRAVRSLLQDTKFKADSDARHNKLAAEINKEVSVDEAKHAALVGRTVDAIQRLIAAGKPVGRKHLSAPQRAVFEEAVSLLDQMGKPLPGD